MKDHSQAAMNSTNLKLRNLLIALECLELEGPAKEIFLRSFDLTEKFFIEFGDKIEDLKTVKARLKAIDNILEDVIKMIRNLMKSLDKSKDKVELKFWEDQMKKLGNFVNIHKKAVSVYYAYLKYPNNPNSEEMENFLCYASAMLKSAGLDLRAFDRVEDDIDEPKVSEAEVKDDESLDKLEETNETTMMVENQNKLDNKLDNNPQVVENVTDNLEVFKKQNEEDQEERVGLDDIYVCEANGNYKNELLEETEESTVIVEMLENNSQVVQKVDDTPEVSEYESDDNLKEKVSLEDTYALEAACNDEDEDNLLDYFEAREAEVSTRDNPSWPKLDSNASFAQVVQVEHHPEETSEDIIGNHSTDIREVEVVGGNGEDEINGVKSNHDIAENDDDEGVGVNDENSDVSNEESIAKFGEKGNTDEDVQGYDEISVNENDDQLDYKVDEDTDDEVRGHIEIKVNENDDKMNNEVCEDILDDEVKNFVVDVTEDSKVILESQNEFIEVVFERNVVKLLFEGTFEENTEETLENLDKFPEPEIGVEEYTFHKHDANVFKLEPEVETNPVEAHLNDIFSGTLDENQDIPEDDTKAKDNNATRVAVVKNVVLVGVTKAVADETVLQEPEPDATAILARNIQTEFKTNVKAEGYEDPENTSLETLKLKLVAKPEKLIHVR